MAREAHNPKVVEMLYVELGRAELHAAMVCRPMS